ncbi:unnamed protein product [Vicia faba]|uniref:RNase H type-1 domain-containing protein n=1 Tax=Vicia faba TaxID=3906 RepID=A0AAV1B9T2_VICFA|nr:unnamed protein product [Vicia faba]
MMITESSLAEMLAIRWWLQLAKSINIENIVIQSDSTLAVDCINSCLDIAVLTPIAVDCRFLLSGFKLASVMFIPKNLNVISHNLVRLGHSKRDKTWLGACPY